MGKKLYVGNLAFSVDSNALQDAFAAFGTVESAKVITDRDTGRSKGFAFVEMSSDEEAQSAISGMNGNPLEGRNVNVSEASPQEPRSDRGGGGGGFNRGGGGGGGYRDRY